MSDPTIVQNEDGSVTVTIDGKATKYSKTSDLLGLKEKAEKQVADLQTKVADANRVKDETHQNLLQATAAKEQLESKAQESVTLTEKVTELEGKLTAADESRKELGAQVKTTRVSNLATLTGKPEDTFKEMDELQLKNFEDTLTAIGFKNDRPKSAAFDNGSGGTEGVELKGRERELAEIRLARERKGKSPDPDLVA